MPLGRDLEKLSVNQPWMVIGDFNSTLFDYERSLVGHILREFTGWVNRKGLNDMGFRGPKYTWSHGNSQSMRKLAYLNCGLCDVN